jgi:hypothetical protein
MLAIYGWRWGTASKQRADRKRPRSGDYIKGVIFQYVVAEKDKMEAVEMLVFLVPIPLLEAQLQIKQRC